MGRSGRVRKLRPELLDYMHMVRDDRGINSLSADQVWDSPAPENTQEHDDGDPYEEQDETADNGAECDDCDDNRASGKKEGSPDEHPLDETGTPDSPEGIIIF